MICLGACAEGKQAAALFACRKAAVREHAERECERFAHAPGASRLTRARLAVADIAAGFAGAGVAVKHDGTPGGADMPVPAGIGVAAEPLAADAIAAIGQPGGLSLSAPAATFSF